MTASAMLELSPNRWDGIKRNYTEQDVEKLRGSIKIEYTLAEQGARKLWDLLHTEDYINALGTFTGNQAVQMVKGRAEGHLSVRLAGGGRRQSCGADVSGPKPLSGRQRAGRGQACQ